LLPGTKCQLINTFQRFLEDLHIEKDRNFKREKYVGGTIFVDHCSSYIHASNQVTLRAGDTVRAKQSFENFATTCGVSIKSYRADNVLFASEEFKSHLELQNQIIDSSGTGAHHQNGVTEHTIQTVAKWARAMLLHSILHRPESTDLELWPFAIDYMSVSALETRVPRKSIIQNFDHISYPHRRNQASFTNPITNRGVSHRTSVLIYSSR